MIKKFALILIGLCFSLAYADQVDDMQRLVEQYPCNNTVVRFEVSCQSSEDVFFCGGVKMSVRDEKTTAWYKVNPSQFVNKPNGGAIEDFKELRAFSCQKDGKGVSYIRLHFSNGGSCEECVENAVFDMHARFKQFGTHPTGRGSKGHQREVELTWLKRGQ